jgi:hypothetical protein
VEVLEAAGAVLQFVGLTRHDGLLLGHTGRWMDNTSMSVP